MNAVHYSCSINVVLHITICDSLKDFLEQSTRSTKRDKSMRFREIIVLTKRVNTARLD